MDNESNNSGLDNWYVLFVKTGQEDKVKERLIYRFGDEFKVLVPKRRIRERRGGKWYFVTRTLFTGYVLVQGNVSCDIIARLRGIPGLIRLLESGSEPLRIEWYEMKVLSHLICNGEIIGLSDVLVENEKIRVIDGPLIDMEGYIINVDHRKGRARIRLNFLGEPRTVELGINLINPAE